MIAIFANDLISKTRAIIMKLSKLPWLSVLTLSALCLVACKELDTHNEYRGKVLTHNFTDPRDNQSYPVVNIGLQVWMAANLNYEMSGSYCSKNRLETYCAKYGRIYSWEAAKNACPAGWHLPSKAEWETLITTVGGDSIAGRVLKSKTGWRNDGNGTDDFGFNALPGGFGSSHPDFGYHIILDGLIGTFWSSTVSDSDKVYFMHLDYQDVATIQNPKKNWGHSVRCIKD